MLIVPIPEAPAGFKPGFNTARENVQLQMTIIQDKQGRRVTPAFSDVVALRAWDPNTPYVGFKAQEFFNVLMTTDVQEVVVNPFDPIRKMVRPGGRITRAEFDLLARGDVPKAFTKGGIEFQINTGQQVAIGMPAKKPSAEVLQSLKVLANSMVEINELYLFQLAAKIDGAWSSHTVIGVNLAGAVSEDHRKKIVQGLGQTAREKLSPGESLDFMIISNNLDQIRKNATLVFQRG
jgi:hypothetical protein